MSNDPQSPVSENTETKPSTEPVTQPAEQTEAPAQTTETANADVQNSEVQSADVANEVPTDAAQYEDTKSDSDAPKSSAGSAIRIGTQRDAANKSLAPAKPKAVRAAEDNPVNLDGETDTTVIEQFPTTTLDELNNQWEGESEEIDKASLDAMMGGDVSGDIADELEIDSRLKATVTRIHNDNVFFRLKAQFEGVTPLKSFKKPPELGLMTDVIVKSYNAEDSLYEVAIPGAAITGADWSDLIEGAIIDVKISGSNTGGLEAMVNGIRGFIPASQIGIHRVENFGDYVGRKLSCVITEVKPKRKNLVLSHRAILEREHAEKKQEMLATIQPDQTYKGKVTKLMDFGAFVDIGDGIEGLIHVSKLSWDRVSHPKEVLEVGQAVEVKIEKVNPENGKIGLSYRDLQEHPWHNIDEKYQAEKTVKGVVSRVADFGAFVKLEPGVEGLVHISELAHYRVQTVKSIVTEGKEVEVKILNVDKDKQKISLSMKALMPEPEKKDAPKEEETDEPLRPSIVKKRDKPLKGGTSRRSDGDKFGLKW